MEIQNLADSQVRAHVKQLAKLVEVLEEGERREADVKGRTAVWYPDGKATPRIGRALVALSEDPVPGELMRKCPVEYDQSQRIAKLMGREPTPGHLWWPVTRDLQAAVAGAGGYLVDTSVSIGSFSAMARAADILVPLGVTVLQQMSSGVFVRMSGDFTVTYLSNEAAPATESTAQFVQAAASPKTAVAYFEISRSSLMSVAPSVEAWVLGQAGAAIGASRATKALQGSGASGEPCGLLNTAGLTSVSGASLTWDIATQTMADVATANAAIDQNALGWALGPGAELVMRRREKAAGSGFVLANGAVDNRRALTSNAVPNTTAIYGDWSQLIVLEWSAIEIGVDKFGTSSMDLFKTGRVGVRAIYSYDVVAPRPASFSAITGIT